MKRLGVAGWVLLTLVATAAVAPWISPYAPDALDLVNRRGVPSIAHWFGTDDLGRDLLSRIFFGARVSLAVGLLSALVAAGIGIGVGATSGYLGGGVDAALMRLTDAALSVPRLLLLMVASAVLSPSIPVLVVLVGLVGWMETARVTRAAFLAAREREFVLAARAAGASAARIVSEHLLPVAAPAIAVAATLAVGRGDPARVGAQLLRDRRATASRQLGQHALPGTVHDEHRALAGALSGPVHFRHGGGD